MLCFSNLRMSPLYLHRGRGHLYRACCATSIVFICKSSKPDNPNVHLIQILFLNFLPAEGIRFRCLICFFKYFFPDDSLKKSDLFSYDSLVSDYFFHMIRSFSHLILCDFFPIYLFIRVCLHDSFPHIWFISHVIHLFSTLIMYLF